MKPLKAAGPDICIKPNGSVALETDSPSNDDLESAAVKSLTKAFSRSAAEGLTFSVSQKCQLKPSVSLRSTRKSVSKKKPTARKVPGKDKSQKQAKEKARSRAKDKRARKKKKATQKAGQRNASPD